MVADIASEQVAGMRRNPQWDGAPYHRAQAVREAARALDIELMPLPGYTVSG